ncbi:MAG TPA: M20/M25/M40 family metallo-hydrolase, partial [Planctomycetota bacterium]|nr:M20/M25/M40 family metallo-hydrolase [Planctomycetota bacterium]
LELIGAHKGVLRTIIRTSGVAAHGSMPERGVNAIYRMAKVVNRLERLAEALADLPAHPRLGHATLNVGTITGGTAVNTVPDSCEIRIDRRMLTGEDAAAVLAELRTAVAGIKGVTIDKPYVSVPGFEIDVNHPWARRVSSALRQTADGVAAYATDASVLHTAGIPCLVYGPGAPGAAHSADEHIAVDEVLRAVEGYRNIIRMMNDE